MDSAGSRSEGSGSYNEDSDEALSDMTDVLQFRAKERKLFDIAYSITRDVDILAKIYDSLTEFKRVIFGNHKLFDRVTSALFELKNSTDGTLLIQFAELGLWGIYSCDELISLLNIFQKDMKDYEYVFVFYQIVPANCKQKLTVSCANNQQCKKLQEYARDCFGVNVDEYYYYITVDIETNNENEIIANYNKLYNYVRRRDEMCSVLMSPIPLLSDIGYDYHEYHCEYSMKEPIDFEKLFKVIKTFPAKLNVGGYNKNGVIGNNNRINFTQFHVDKKQLAIDWIKGNLPNHHEVAADYYGRYSAQIAQPDNLMAYKQFNKLVAETGYKKFQGAGNIRRWKKK